MLVNQLGTLVIIRLATGYQRRVEHRRWGAVYQMAFAIFMLPQSVITVSLVTALLPHLSKQAAAGRFDIMRERIGWTLRTSGSLVVPAATAFMVLGVPIAVLLFRYGSLNLEAARLLGLTLSAFAIGLPAFSAYYVLMRGFYALEDTRTPTLNADHLERLQRRARRRGCRRGCRPTIAIPALGLAYALSYWIGLATLAPRLRRTPGRARGLPRRPHLCARHVGVASGRLPR